MALLKPITPETEALLAAMPSAGDTHLWLAKVASRLSKTFPESYTHEILTICADYVTHRKIPAREISDAVAFGYGRCNAGKGIKTYTWPEPQPTLIGEVLAGSEPICNPAMSTGMRPEEVIKCLYCAYDIICISKDQYSPEAYIWPDDFGGVDLAQYQYIVPNPLKAMQGVNKAGEPSVRCQDNIDYRRFIVVEFDKEPDKMNQSRLIGFLSDCIPCVMVVDSGGKSLHGWFPVYDITESKAAMFFGKATALGADASIYDPCKLVRMPGGLRAGKTRQKIIYWDEEALPNDDAA